MVDTLIASSAFKADAYLDRADLYEAAGEEARALQDRRTALAIVERGIAKRPSAMRRQSRARALLALEREADLEDALDDPPEPAPDLDQERARLAEARASCVTSAPDGSSCASGRRLHRSPLVARYSGWSRWRGWRDEAATDKMGPLP